MASKYKELMDEVKLGIDSFKSDPPDSDHQEGYLSALEEIERVGKMLERRRREQEEMLLVLQQEFPDYYQALLFRARQRLEADTRT